MYGNASAICMMDELRSKRTAFIEMGRQSVRLSERKGEYKVQRKNRHQQTYET